MKKILSVLLAIIMILSTLSILCSCDMQGEPGVQGEQGLQGEKGDQGDPGSKGEPGDKGDKGDTGADGNGIVSVLKTSSEGLVDTYTVTFTDGTTTTFTVNNGEKGDTGATGADGATGEKGDKGDTGVGILKVEIIDGYLWITYTDAPDTPVNVGKIEAEQDGTEGLEFYPLPDGTYGVMAGTTKYLSEIVIPATYKSKAVTQILPDAFRDAVNLKSIEIPDSVTSIGSSAFSGCSSLESITIPFVGATKDGTENTHFGYIFGASSYLYNGDYLPSSLKTVVITGGESIGEEAFYNCDSLTSIEIPDSVTSICERAFYGCDSLIYNEYDNAYYLGNSNNPYVVLIKAKNKDITSCNINSNTKFIYADAFYECQTITSLVIPDSVTSIGNSAFYNCSSLTSIVIPDSVTSIGNYAFSGCLSLTSVVIGNGVTSIGNYAFSWCNSLTSIVIPDSVTSIGYFAFQACSSLTSVVIGTGVTIIGYSAFSECNSLESITLPFVGAAKDGSTYTNHFGYIFGASAFPYNSQYVPSSLKTVVITGVTSIGEYAFYGCSGLTSVTIGDGVTSIGDYAFSSCTGLTSVTIGDGVTSIGTWAFYGCGTVESITLPFVGATKGGTENTHFGYIFGATSSSSHSDYVPSSLKTVVITGSESIGNYAFEYCSSLTSVTIPDSVTSIGYSSFYGCSSLTDVYITDIAAWCSIAFPHYDANPLYYTKNLYLNGELVTELVIPDGVTSIGDYAFCGYGNLTSVEIPDSVTSIGGYAFSNCDNLIYNEYDNAYYLGNSNNPYIVLIKAKSEDITSCDINPNTKFIHSAAFYECHSLTGVVIPNGVTSIGNYAFKYCESLTSINFTGTKEGWNSITKVSSWNYNTGNYTVYCTDGNISK